MGITVNVIARLISCEVFKHTKNFSRSVEFLHRNVSGSYYCLTTEASLG